MFRLIIFSCLFLATFVLTNCYPKLQRIVGGEDTVISKVPYQASVLLDGKHECGGCIIGAHYILTAAHCVEGKSHNRFSIRAGSAFLSFGGQKVDVDTIIPHPHYNNNTANYDAAILILKNPLTHEGNKIEIASFANVEPKVGEKVLISGWGSRRNGRDLANFLQSVEVPVVSKKFCIERYKSNITVTDQMFCAGDLNGGKDSCQGDSGGPAMVNGQLAGIVSWGDGCAQKNSPGVYTKVLSIIDWIAANTLDILKYWPTL